MVLGSAAQSVRILAYMAGMGLVVAGGEVALRASAAAPAKGVCQIKTGAPARVSEILGGGALKLADGRKVLLSGIDAPRAKPSGGATPFSAESMAALAKLVEGGAIRLSDAGQPSKTGWLRAQVFTGSGTWVQGELVSGGFARVRTFPDRRECAAELLLREGHAREAKKGLWRLPAYAVRGADIADKGKGGFGLVQGVIANTANIGGRLFLNFGQDYRTDFTVHVKPESAKLFAQAGLDLEALEGKTIRVRGFIRERNGPVIDAVVPEQIEVVR